MMRQMILIPHINLAVPAHARDIAVMSREYIEYGLGWSWTHARVLRAISDESTNVAVVREQDAMLGFGIMTYGERKAHLALLAVHLGHRNRGLGAMLLAWLEKCAVTAGLEHIQVEARVDNQPALAFYQSQGYQQQGIVSGYYSGIIDAVRFRKDLFAAPNGRAG
jgi:ribosomal protein S18 acetylase RimI-like enzyme